jgi:hypothetical protein
MLNWTHVGLIVRSSWMRSPCLRSPLFTCIRLLPLHLDTTGRRHILSIFLSLNDTGLHTCFLTEGEAKLSQQLAQEFGRHEAQLRGDYSRHPSWATPSSQRRPWTVGESSDEVQNSLPQAVARATSFAPLCMVAVTAVPAEYPSGLAFWRRVNVLRRTRVC